MMFLLPCSHNSSSVQFFVTSIRSKSIESFHLQTYGPDLREAYNWCMRYQETRRDADLHQAWDLYYHIFRRINKNLPSVQSLDLKNVSGTLYNAHDLELAVPGTYVAGEEVVTIQSFAQTLQVAINRPLCTAYSAPAFYIVFSFDTFYVGLVVVHFVIHVPWRIEVSTTVARFQSHFCTPAAGPLQVIQSKQRPRKLTIVGCNMCEYQFLLKGHEDLRQDERAMQLFGLVNNLLAESRDTAERDLSIARYAVIPLSPNSGLIGWVRNCDTMHALIREYRESRRIALNAEHRIMQNLAPNYDQMMVIQKVEVFEDALERTSGDDLHKVPVQCCSCLWELGHLSRSTCWLPPWTKAASAVEKDILAYAVVMNPYAAGSLVEKPKQRDVARQADQLHAFDSRHVNGRLPARSWGSSPIQSHAGPLLW
jgi:hypothetical protein